MTTQARELAGIISNAGDLSFTDDVTLGSDGAILNFGADSDVTITHVADTGLTIKNAHTSGNSGIGAVLTLQTGDTDMAVNDVIGAIDFVAPDEGTGTDAITTAGSVRVISEGDFSASNNAAKMSCMLGLSGAASEGASLNELPGSTTFGSGSHNSVTFGSISLLCIIA